jgi:DNA-binding NarL/FixJ family response regulator
MADDHEIFRDGLRLLASRLEGVDMVAMAENGKQLIEFVEKFKPDIVLTDIRMPVMDGMEATRFIVKNFSDVGVVGLTMYEEEDQIIDMLEAGAKGYLLKNASKEEIQQAIHTVYNGQNYYCGQTLLKMTRLIAKTKFQQDEKRSKILFTDKELEIIKLLCDGLTSKEIANTIHLSYRTVEGYRTKIQEKMEVHNTASIIIYALKNKLATI